MEQINIMDNTYRDLLYYQTLLLQKNNAVNDIQPQEIKLNQVEIEILYFLARSESPNEIAKYFSTVGKKISKLTVSWIILNQLYPKFKVRSDSELLDKAYSLKLIPFILESFI